MATGQFKRRCSLLLLPRGTTGNNPSAFVAGGTPMDLSNFQIKFETVQQDEESPNNCSIRVFNLSAATVKAVRDEYSQVVLQAGYEGSSFGVIFQGQVKQYRIGRTDNKTTYLDILACDGDMAYNWALVNQTLAAGSSSQDRINAAIKAMQPYGISAGQVIATGTGGTLPRGKVLFGYAKATIRSETQTNGQTWNINNGQVNIIPLDGYLPGEAVVLNSGTGLIGRPEQTQDGIKARCLLNPKIVIGGLVKIDQASINQTAQQRDFVIPQGQLPYDRYAGVQMLANVAADGLYRVYVAEHRGDTRGQEWYSDLVCLTVDPVTNKVKPYG